MTLEYSEKSLIGEENIIREYIELLGVSHGSTNSIDSRAARLRRSEEKCIGRM